MKISLMSYNELLYSYALIMGAEISSETLVNFYQAMRHHITEEGYLLSYHLENFKYLTLT